MVTTPIRVGEARGTQNHGDSYQYEPELKSIHEAPTEPPPTFGLIAGSQTVNLSLWPNHTHPEVG